MMPGRLRARRRECAPKCFVNCCARRNGSARLRPSGCWGSGPSVRMTTRPPRIHDHKECGQSCAFGTELLFGGGGGPGMGTNGWSSDVRVAGRCDGE
jgi:hypothetical protein